MTKERSNTTQQQLLLAIAFHTRTHGYAPSIRDLQYACTLSSPSVVKHHLTRLRRKGMVDWVDGQARTLHLVKRAS